MYKIYSLKCEGMKDPVGIDSVYPRFSWKLWTDEHNQKQTAYRVIVVNDNGDTVWDSNIIKENQNTNIHYDGIKLEDHTTYKWRIYSYGKDSAFAASTWASFSVGMLSGQWIASWISSGLDKKPEEPFDMIKFFGDDPKHKDPRDFLDPPIYFRKRVHINKPVKRAVAYATARGIYQLLINGQLVSEPLAPGFTSYHNFLEVQQYNILEYLNNGELSIGAILADGWYTGKIGLLGIGSQFGTSNDFFLQIELQYEDGTRESICSDESFEWRTGNYEYGDLFIGERYRQDALSPHWFNDDSKGWVHAVIKEYVTQNLKGRRAEPVKVIRQIPPYDIRYTPSGDLIIDAGENIAGFLKISMNGLEGQEVCFIHSEILDNKGEFLMNIAGDHKNQTDVFVFSRDSSVEYTPAFTYHGFRYVKVIGLERDNIIDVKICVLGTDLERTGSFTCSDFRLNRLQENIVRSQQSNMISIPTDCPQRERSGWIGDVQIFASTACFNMDVYSFLRKWLANMRFEQYDDGQIPNVIPDFPSNRLMFGTECKHICSSGYGDCCIILPYQLYMKYGYTEILAENFDMMEKWMVYIQSLGDDLGNEFHFGDWLYPSASGNGMENPMQSAYNTKEYVSLEFFAYSAMLMENISNILGQCERAIYYHNLYIKIKEKFARAYIDDEGCLPVQIQGLYVLALAFDLFPNEKKDQGVKQLVQLIHDKGDCLDCGFLSIPFLLNVLYDNGQKELAYTLLFQTKSPSWLYEVEQGATTMWESWKAILPDGTRTNASYNHFAFGCIGDFIYRRIGGLYALSPGYRNVRIAPDYDCGLSEAELSYESVFGRIKIHWINRNGRKKIETELPVGVSGVLYLDDSEYPISSGTYTKESIA